MIYPRLNLVVLSQKIPTNAIEVDESRVASLHEVTNMGCTPEPRTSGQFYEKAYFLNSSVYDWVIGRDDQEQIVLIALKKEV